MPPSIWAPSVCPGWQEAETACSDTIDGWLWFCDDCISHGTADSEEEARFVAKAHARYMRPLGAECCIAVVRMSK